MVAYISDSQNEKELSPFLCQHQTLKAKLVLGKMYLERSEGAGVDCQDLCPWPIASRNKLPASKNTLAPLKYGENKDTVYFLCSHEVKGKKVI